MKDYNFAKNYQNIKLWEYKEQTVDFSAENNIFDQFLNILDFGNFGNSKQNNDNIDIKTKIINLIEKIENSTK